MSGAPQHLASDNDFIQVRLSVVEQVGLDAALLFARLSFRLDLDAHSDGYVASYGALAQETRISEKRVRTAAKVLVDAGWIARRRRSSHDATSVWTIEWEDATSGDAPQGTSDESSALEGTSGDALEGRSTVLQEVEEELHITPDGALFEAPKVDKIPTTQDLVAAWVDGYRETHEGENPDKAILRRVAGQCAQLAKTRTDLDSWRVAWHACKAAGGRNVHDPTKMLGGGSAPWKREGGISALVDVGRQLMSTESPFAALEGGLA